jgi:hypothetical protein
MPAEEEDDEAYREGTVHLVAVTLEGFMVTRRSSDLNPVRERLAALPDIYEGSFRWNASPGTVANPKTNPIRLPQIVPPPKPPDPAEMAAERGREEAAPAPSPEGAEEVERISFENEKEVIVPFTAEYLVRSSVWRPEPEASAPAEEE